MKLKSISVLVVLGLFLFSCGEREVPKSTKPEGKVFGFSQEIKGEKVGRYSIFTAFNQNDQRTGWFFEWNTPYTVKILPEDQIVDSDYVYVLSQMAEIMWTFSWVDSNPSLVNLDENALYAEYEKTLEANQEQILDKESVDLIASFHKYVDDEIRRTSGFNLIVQSDKGSFSAISGKFPYLGKNGFKGLSRRDTLTFLLDQVIEGNLKSNAIFRIK